MRILATLVAATFALPAAAHEFWIEPLAYQITTDENLQGELINGQDFGGTQLAFLPQRFVRFTAAAGLRQGDVENRLGARPALDIAPLAEGLNVVSYQSTMSTVNYAEWEKFVGFSEHKAFEDIEARHDARGLPRDGFTEAYWRYAKTLIGVGNSIGDDFRTGLETEFVALDNPYTDDLSDGLRVQLFYQEDIVAGGQVELFEKSPNGEVEITLHRTNDDGIATLPVKAGHSYLVDHVVLRVPSDALLETGTIAWETLWADMTFGVPE
ncbi:DUF4198 domain-containing protein [Octadecabacter sp.]|nr:DUF4198 domain-containing protein [Octadecabacter sp.]